METQHPLLAIVRVQRSQDFAGRAVRSILTATSARKKPGLLVRFVIVELVVSFVYVILPTISG
jgi:hypothetical protein